MTIPKFETVKYDFLCVIHYRLCVVLITKKEKSHDSYRDGFRKYSQRSGLSDRTRVQFAYVYEDTQQDFIRSLSKGKQLQSGENKLKVRL
jgi:DnaJ family protein C protein 16